MAKREVSMARTMARRLWGQEDGSPSGVADQSSSAIRRAIVPPRSNIVSRTSPMHHSPWHTKIIGVAMFSRFPASRELEMMAVVWGGSWSHLHGGLRSGYWCAHD